MNLLEAMHSRPTETGGRPHKQLFVIRENFTIGEYTCWDCDTENYWWCPDYGYSIQIGNHAFETKYEAEEVRDLMVEEEIKRLEELYTK